mgnify:CR=1 FL=1
MAISSTQIYRVVAGLLMIILDEDGHNQSNLPFSKKEQELYGLDEEDAFFANLDIDTINILYQKMKCESEMKIKSLMKFLNGR